MKKSYKNLKLLILFLSIMSFSASAQIFSILGTGTTFNALTGYPAPYGNWYGGSRHMLFVTAAELSAAGVAGGAQISSIGFNVQSLNGAAPHQGWNMKVYTTTSADPLASAFLAGTPVTSSTVSTITGTIGWNHTNLTPFIWNGSDNLVIETCFNNLSYTYNYSTYWETTLTGSSIKSRWNNQDNTPGVCSNASSNQSANTRPNLRFEWISPTPCTVTPSANSVLTPTYAICPNSSVTIGFASSYTVGGIQYQWQSSTTSSVGPFTAIPNATNTTYSTPNMTVNTWYNALLTCSTVPGSTTTASAGLVAVSPVITNNVPYFEGFEGLNSNDALPNCSWAASNLSTNCLTYISSNTLGRTPRSGSKFASFYYNPGGTRYFYTNGVQLEAGVTYSASLWFQTEYYGYNNWTDLSILMGTSQTTTGLVSIASTNGPAISNVYKSLSNTFTVSSSGLYYFAIRGTANTSSSAQYLSWDDFSVIIPCTPASGNSPSITVSASSNTICEGQSVNITVTGADTYTWSNGSNANVLTETPMNNATYNVVGTNTLTGCTQTISQAISVTPSPTIFVVADKVTVCAGSPAVLTALGGVSYTWNTGAMMNVTSVNPAVATTYTVLGSNAAGCSSQATQLINVNSLPNVNAVTSAPVQMCVGEIVNLTGAGAVSYQWLSSSSSIIYQGTPISVSPNVTTTYTLTGTDANGCSKSVTLVQVVDPCTGINQITAASSAISIFPNPTTGDLTIESKNNSFKVIEVVDLSGRVILSEGSSDETIKMSLNSFANGIYYVKIQTNSSTEVVKIVKN